HQARSLVAPPLSVPTGRLAEFRRCAPHGFLPHKGGGDDVAQLCPSPAFIRVRGSRIRACLSAPTAQTTIGLRMPADRALALAEAILRQPPSVGVGGPLASARVDRPRPHLHRVGWPVGWCSCPARGRRAP